jgi:hypothetical protein
MGRTYRHSFGLLVCLIWVGCSEDKPKGPPVDTDQFDNPTTLSGRGGGGRGAGSSGSGFLDGSCANGRVNAARVPPKVILVLDGSCSMSTNYPANGAESSTECTANQTGRWTALRNALINPQNGVVPRLESAVAFGLIVYGTAPNCPIPGLPVRPMLGNLRRVTDQLPMVQPGMYTPTGPALDWVYENWIEAQGPDTNGAAQIVILATDGEPNSCGGGGDSGRGGRGNNMGGMGNETNYQPSLDAVRKGTAKGATTYVISLADATGPFHDHLQELANLGNPLAGGAAQLYEPASPEQLAANLQSLAGGAVGCDIELNGAIAVAEACSGTVTLDGMPLTCNDPNGWRVIDERNIQLQGEACKRLMANNNASLEATFTCTAFRPD